MACEILSESPIFCYLCGTNGVVFRRHPCGHPTSPPVRMYPIDPFGLSIPSYQTRFFHIFSSRRSFSKRGPSPWRDSNPSASWQVAHSPQDRGVDHPCGIAMIDRSRRTNTAQRCRFPRGGDIMDGYHGCQGGR